MTDATGPVPRTLSLAVGETADVRLPGLGGAGYLWQADVDGADGVVRVELHRGGPAARGRVGSLPESVRVTALARGRVVLHLAQRRPWEGGVDPIAAHDVAIDIE